MKGDSLSQEVRGHAWIRFWQKGVRIRSCCGASALGFCMSCAEHCGRQYFFFVGFNFIVLTTNLLVADYAVAVSNFMLGTVAALVVGKAVITANEMPFLKPFDRAPLIQPILFKTAIYWIATFIAGGALRAFLDR